MNNNSEREPVWKLPGRLDLQSVNEKSRRRRLGWFLNVEDEVGCGRGKDEDFEMGGYSYICKSD